MTIKLSPVDVAKKRSKHEFTRIVKKKLQDKNEPTTKKNKKKYRRPTSERASMDVSFPDARQHADLLQ